MTVNLKSRLALEQQKELKSLSEHLNGTNRDQTVLFPDTIDEYVEKTNSVRFIDAFADSLNMEKLGFKHSILVSGLKSAITFKHLLMPSSISLLIMM